MFFYLKEGGELWQKYFIELIIYIMEVYSCFSFDYFYFVVQLVNGLVGGMEYLMIIFNGLCIEFCDDGFCIYLLVEKCFFIGVVIYEVGYIYFFMMVNFDEC